MAVVVEPFPCVYIFVPNCNSHRFGTVCARCRVSAPLDCTSAARCTARFMHFISSSMPRSRVSHSHKDACAPHFLASTKSRCAVTIAVMWASPRLRSRSCTHVTRMLPSMSSFLAGARYCISPKAPSVNRRCSERARQLGCLTNIRRWCQLSQTLLGVRRDLELVHKRTHPLCVDALTTC